MTQAKMRQPPSTSVLPLIVLSENLLSPCITYYEATREI